MENRTVKVQGRGQASAAPDIEPEEVEASESVTIEWAID